MELSNVIALLFLVLLHDVSSEASAVGCSNLSLQPHPDDCAKFIQIGSTGAVKMHCPEGLHFNPKLNICDWPHQAGCLQTPERPNDANELFSTRYRIQENGMNLRINPTDCSEYIQMGPCGETIMKCPFGLSFNPENNICDWTRNVPGCFSNNFEQISVSTEGENGNSGDKGNACIEKRIYQHPTQCRKFVMCAPYGPQEIECPDGTYFDPLTKLCDGEYECPTSSDQPSNIEDANDYPDNFESSPEFRFFHLFRPHKFPSIFSRPPRPSIDSQAHSILSPNPCKTTGYFPHPLQCETFIMCTVKHAFVMRCPLGLHFNPSSKVCDLPFHSSCNLNLPTVFQNLNVALPAGTNPQHNIHINLPVFPPEPMDPLPVLQNSDISMPSNTNTQNNIHILPGRPSRPMNPRPVLQNSNDLIPSNTNTEDNIHREPVASSDPINLLQNQYSLNGVEQELPSVEQHNSSDTQVNLIDPLMVPSSNPMDLLQSQYSLNETKQQLPFVEQHNFSGTTVNLMEPLISPPLEPTNLLQTQYLLNRTNPGLPTIEQLNYSGTRVNLTEPVILGYLPVTNSSDQSVSFIPVFEYENSKPSIPENYSPGVLQNVYTPVLQKAEQVKKIPYNVIEELIDNSENEDSLGSIMPESADAYLFSFFPKKNVPSRNQVTMKHSSKPLPGDYDVDPSPDNMMLELPNEDMDTTFTGGYLLFMIPNKNTSKPLTLASEENTEPLAYTMDFDLPKEDMDVTFTGGYLLSPLPNYNASEAYNSTEEYNNKPSGDNMIFDLPKEDVTITFTGGYLLSPLLSHNLTNSSGETSKPSDDNITFDLPKEHATFTFTGGYLLSPVLNTDAPEPSNLTNISEENGKPSKDDVTFDFPKEEEMILFTAGDLVNPLVVDNTSDTSNSSNPGEQSSAPKDEEMTSFFAGDLVNPLVFDNTSHTSNSNNPGEQLSADTILDSTTTFAGGHSSVPIESPPVSTQTYLFQLPRGKVNVTLNGWFLLSFLVKNESDSEKDVQDLKLLPGIEGVENGSPSTNSQATFYYDGMIHPMDTPESSVVNLRTFGASDAKKPVDVPFHYGGIIQPRPTTEGIPMEFHNITETLFNEMDGVTSNMGIEDSNEDKERVTSIDYNTSAETSMNGMDEVTSFMEKGNKNGESESKMSLVSSCAGRNSMTVLPLPGDCTKYIVCLDEKGEIKNCLIGTFFTPQEEKCTENSSYCVTDLLVKDYDRMPLISIVKYKLQRKN